MSLVTRLLEQRHAYYRALLALEVLVLIGLRGLQAAPRLVSVIYLLISGLAVLLDSPLLPRNRLEAPPSDSLPARLTQDVERVLLQRRKLAWYWLLAVILEGCWQAALQFNPTLALHLSPIHLTVWLVLMLNLLWWLVKALAEEPYFSLDLVIGAAAGYLLVGFTGGIVLNSLLVLDPTAFHLEAHAHALPDGVGHAPAMLGAAFASLTTMGSPLLYNGSLTLLSASTGITIVGQLYIAILIAGILGKPRRSEAIPEAAHPQRPRASVSRKIRLRNR